MSAVGYSAGFKFMTSFSVKGRMENWVNVNCIDLFYFSSRNVVPQLPFSLTLS